MCKNVSVIYTTQVIIIQPNLTHGRTVYVFIYEDTTVVVCCNICASV